MIALYSFFKISLNDVLYLLHFMLYYKEMFVLANYKNGRSGIMATKSFIDTYVINRDDVNRFHNIMNNKKQLE